MTVRKDVDRIVTKYARNTARGSLEAFIDGRQELEWAIGMVRMASVRGAELQEIFDQLVGYGDAERWRKAYGRCRNEGWL